MKTPNHLGGHMGVTHIDDATFKYLVEKFNVKSFLDIGCGPGGMVEHAVNNGLKALGIDGDPAISGTFPLIKHDFTIDTLHLEDKFDLGWCVECLEHIEEQYLFNVFNVFKKCDYIVITHALPGEEGGKHHVNLQNDEYWIHAFEANGFKYDQRTTLEIRDISSMKKNFMRKTGKFFVRIKW